MNLLLIDGHYLFGNLFRTLNSDNEGEVDVDNFFNTCFGFIKKMISTNNSSHALLCMDDLSSSFRREILAEYRMNRFLMPLSILTKMPAFLKRLDKIGVKSKVSSKNESCDIIATIASKIISSSAKANIVIVGSDSRLQSFLYEGVEIYSPLTSGKVSRKDADWFESEFGFPVKSFLMYSVLIGDKHKSIPGIPGVGEKNASKLVKEYKSLKKLFEDMPEINSKIGESLRKNLESLTHKTFYLHQLKRNVSVGINMKDLKIK